MTNIKIIRVENGWIIQTGIPHSGILGKEYVAETVKKLTQLVKELAEGVND